MRKLFAGRQGDQCIIFRDQGRTDPPGGPHLKSVGLEFFSEFSVCQVFSYQAYVLCALKKCLDKNIDRILVDWFKMNYSSSRWYTIANTNFFTYYLYLWVKVTQNVAQYLLNNVTYAPLKFEVAMSNGKGGDSFTRKYIIWPWPNGQGHTKCCPVPYTSCDLCICEVWSCYV